MRVGMGLLPAAIDEPYLMGAGPSSCSSETALSVVPAYIFDVNRYYRTLGVNPNLRPSKRDLRIAYQALQPYGPTDEWITYCFQQLINPEVRAEYDAMPLGVPYLDFYEQEKIRRRAQAEASRRMAERGENPLDMEAQESHMKDIFEGLGLWDDESEEALDGNVDDRQDEPASPAKFEFAYYLWRTRGSDSSRLSEWQSLVALAISRRGLRQKFAVGFHGRAPQSWLMADLGHELVFLLNTDSAPTAEMADQVASMLSTK